MVKRRQFIGGLAALGGSYLLTACGGGGEDGSSGTTGAATSKATAHASTASASGTAMPPASSITDSAGAVWTLSGGVLYKNGAVAGGQLQCGARAVVQRQHLSPKQERPVLSMERLGMGELPSIRVWAAFPRTVPPYLPRRTSSTSRARNGRLSTASFTRTASPQVPISTWRSYFGTVARSTIATRVVSFTRTQRLRPNGWRVPIRALPSRRLRVASTVSTGTTTTPTRQRNWSRS